MLLQPPASDKKTALRLTAALALGAILGCLVMSTTMVRPGPLIAASSPSPSTDTIPSRRAVAHPAKYTSVLDAAAPPLASQPSPNQSLSLPPPPPPSLPPPPPSSTPPPPPPPPSTPPPPPASSTTHVKREEAEGESDVDPSSFQALREAAKGIFTPRVLDTAAPPVVVAFMGWPNRYPMPQAVEELSVVTYMIEQATGRKVAYPSWDQPYELQWEQAHVLILNAFGEGGRGRLNELAAKYRATKLLIWTLIENVYRNEFFAPYTDMLVNDVQVSLGGRRDPISDNYLRYPGWMGWALRPSEYGCTWPPEWEHSHDPAGGASGWAARSKFAAIVANHGGFPRDEATNLLESLEYGAVDGLSHFHHTVDIDTQPGENTYDTKIRFLRDYQFNICPENSQSPDGGYNTEKLINSLQAGCVPIYWGDTPIESGLVFNRRRIIHWTTPQEVEAKVRGLMANEGGMRDRWFEEPLLKPAAHAWLAQWCSDARQLIAEKWDALGVAS